MVIGFKLEVVESESDRISFKSIKKEDSYNLPANHLLFLISGYIKNMELKARELSNPQPLIYAVENIVSIQTDEKGA